MEPAARLVNSLSPRRIAGFACNQGFVFFLFYMGLNRELSFGPYTIERAELIGALFFMLVTFLVLRLISQRLQAVVLARPFLLLYALMAAIGSSLPYFAGEATTARLIAESLLLGLPGALLLAAWGRLFGESRTKVSVPEVFLASLLGALFCLLVSLIPLSRADLVFRILPFASVAALMVSAQTDFKPRSIVSSVKEVPDTAVLSAKIVAGTMLFGMAAGLMEAFSTNPGMAAMPTFSVAFILFIAFAIGTLSILLSDGFGKGAALNKAYRLALFIMLMGYLMVPAPFFVDSAVSGEAIVLAGFMGLSAVMISLFLVLASITGTSAISSFSRGFAALFGGEAIGIVLANILNATQLGEATPYSAVIVAGILVLFSYVFLFTERDFNELSEIVTKTDTFEDRCRAIVEHYGLSNREAEVLPYILKGRTSERISQELFITKSTVDTHLRRIYAKAGVHSRQELIDLGESDLVSQPKE